MTKRLRPSGGLIASVRIALIALIVGQALPAAGVTFTSDTTINTTQYVGQDIIVSGCTLTIDCSPGIGNYNSITLQSATLTHPPESANGLWLNIAGNVSIDVWSAINVNGRGHQGGTGPGSR